MKGINALLMGLVMFVATTSVAMSQDSKSSISVHPDKRTTHLNVRVGEIINLETFCLTNDGTTNELFYDRSTNPLQIPQDHSFVVTDIIAQPFCLGGASPDAVWHVLLQGPLARNFEIRFRGDSIVHYALSGALAYTSDNVPEVRTIRDASLSTGGIEIQVLGYFVRGDALAPEAPRF
jgi:hypothetical protein